MTIRFIIKKNILTAIIKETGKKMCITNDGFYLSNIYDNEIRDFIFKFICESNMKNLLDSKVNIFETDYITEEEEEEELKAELEAEYNDFGTYSYNRCY